MLDELDDHQRTLVVAAISLVTGPFDQDTHNRVISEALSRVPRDFGGTAAQWMLTGHVINVARALLAALDEPSRQAAVERFDRMTTGVEFDRITRDLKMSR